MNKKISVVLGVVGALGICASVQAGSAEAGKAKAEPCADCHGADGKGDKDSPSVVGMSVGKFTAAMKEYQAETRTKSKKMIKAAKKVNDEDIADLAAYFATLK